MTTQKVQTHAGVAGSGATVLIAWMWNTFMPEYPMPAEVAAGLTGIIGPVVAWCAGWLKQP